MTERSSTATAELTDGHCFYCREMTNRFAGDPGLWPLQFCQPDGTGISRFHHTRCVVDRLRVSAQGSRDCGEPVAWRYKRHDGQLVYMTRRLTDQQKIDGYLENEDDDGENGPFHCSEETPLFGSAGQMPIRAPGNDQLSALWNAIVENTKGDGFWIGEILLSVLEREVGFNPAALSSTQSAPPASESSHGG